MADELKAITPQEALIREAEVLERLATVYRAIASGGGAVEPIAPSSIASQAANPVPAEIPLARLGIEDAIKYVLRTARTPRKTSQIYKPLLAADYQFVGDDPMHAIQGALKRLSMKANPEAVYVGGGKWTLVGLYTPAQLEKLKQKLSGLGGRSSKEHARRTKDAMIAKGVRFGRRPKFGPDDIKKFRHLVEVEKMRPLKALEQCGMSTAFYYQYKDEIYAWKEGEPWPPAGKRFWGRRDTGTEDEMRDARVIPLHGRTGNDAG